MESKQQDYNDKGLAILLSTYNGALFLRQQLESLYLQTFKDFTLYVRDDLSSDYTCKIIDEWKEKLDIIIIDSTKNLGAAESFMTIIKQVPKYKYYAFCDQDDIWDKAKIEKAISQLNGINKPALYFCNSRVIDADNNVISVGRPLKQKEISVESELVCGYCPGCSMVFNWGLMDIVKRQKYQHIPMHDMLYVMNAIVYGEVIYDTEPLYSRRMHRNNAVGKIGKNFQQRVKQSLNNWFVKSKKYPLDVFVSDFLNNIQHDVANYDLSGIIQLAHYNDKLINRFLLISNKKFSSSNKSGNRSFKIRAIMGVL